MPQNPLCQFGSWKQVFTLRNVHGLVSSLARNMATMEEGPSEVTDTVAENKETEDTLVIPTSKRSDRIVKDPNFAIVCSFIKIFGPLLRFQELSIETIEHFFDTPTEGIINPWSFVANFFFSLRTVCIDNAAFSYKWVVFFILIHMYSKLHALRVNWTQRR